MPPDTATFQEGPRLARPNDSTAEPLSAVRLTAIGRSSNRYQPFDEPLIAVNITTTKCIFTPLRA